MAEHASGEMVRARPRDTALSTVPIAKVSRAGLRRLLVAESAEWMSRLGWEFTDVADLIVEAVSHGVLKGMALVDDDVVGIAVYTTESRRCLIGEVYVEPSRRSPAALRMIVDAMLGAMPAKDRRKRVESQSIVFDSAGADEAFEDAGFARAARAYLVADVETAPASASLRSTGRLKLRSWLDTDFGAASEIVHASYKGSVDAVANSGYRTREGCADLVDALTEGVWCGRFDPAMTQIAVDAATGRTCAVAIVSKISDGVAHIGQISVFPTYQGRGVGRALVEGVLAGARLARYASVSLAVTLANERALHLYETCGFRRAVEFPVYFRDSR
jgi:ribosomal protein S18 acetylase RimI-like enzyme